MACLLVFNGYTKAVSVKEICEVTDMNRMTLADHLVSLAHPSVQVLLKRPDNRRLEDDHRFMINPKFKSSTFKVLVPVLTGIVDGLHNGTSAHNDDALLISRRNALDCAIVRIMKSRGKLDHGELIAEVLAQLRNRFEPKISDIKKRIESLIEYAFRACIV